MPGTDNSDLHLRGYIPILKHPMEHFFFCHTLFVFEQQIYWFGRAVYCQSLASPVAASDIRTSNRSMKQEWEKYRDSSTDGRVQTRYPAAISPAQYPGKWYAWIRRPANRK